MTKLQWKRHFDSVKTGGIAHDFEVCPLCLERLKTKRANERAKAIRSAYAVFITSKSAE
jgi:hypothetical protein